MADTGAIFSPDRVYRYALFRRWQEGRRSLVVIGLNPSTADETKDDPTIRRCIGFAKSQRCDALVMLNLFAFRSTDPAALRHVADPVGPENDAMIRQYAWPDVAVVLAAWGAGAAEWPARVATVQTLVPALNCLGVTKDGHPRHPLYVKADTPMVRWRILDLMAALKESLAATSGDPTPAGETK